MRKIPWVAFGMGVLCLAAGFAVSGQDPRQQKLQQREIAEDYYKRWLNEDVAYIITSDERGVFGNLTTAEEKDKFIEQFWVRRDPDPRTPTNEYKEEHYRRIQYANDRFHAGIPGWRTDRGRVYIMFGPPDRKESYPAGGWYDRKDHEGGGSTSVFPFEIWEYRYIEGVGTDIELEFVDPSASNLYRLTMDPQEKDEFLHVPGMGLTFYEMFDPEQQGKGKSFNRVQGIRRQGLLEYLGITERVKDQPFQKSEMMLRIAKAPLIRYNDLKELIDTSVYYNQLPFTVATHFIQMGPTSYLVPLTVLVDNREISFEKIPTGRRSSLQVYGLVSTPTKRVEFEWDDDITAEYGEAEFEIQRDLSGVYQRKLALTSGRYKVDLIIKDTVSGKIGIQAIGIQVPSNTEEKLSTSSIFLTRRIEAADTDMTQPFILGSFKIKPQLDKAFAADGDIGFYLEIYNYQIDQLSQEPQLEIQYAIAPRGTVPDSFRTVRQGLGQAPDRVYLARLVQMSDLGPGQYELVCRVTDRLRNESVTAKEAFTVLAASTHQ